MSANTEAVKLVDKGVDKTVIQEGVEIVGEIRIKNSTSIVVMGRVEGFIETNGDLIVESSGVIDGCVIAQNLLVKGCIETKQKVYVKGCISMAKGGILTAESIHYGDMQQSSGSRLRGLLMPYDDAAVLQLEEKQSTAVLITPPEVHRNANVPVLTDRGDDGRMPVKVTEGASLGGTHAAIHTPVGSVGNVANVEGLTPTEESEVDAVAEKIRNKMNAFWKNADAPHSEDSADQESYQTHPNAQPIAQSVPQPMTQPKPHQVPDPKSLQPLVSANSGDDVLKPAATLRHEDKSAQPSFATLNSDQVNESEPLQSVGDLPFRRF